MRIFEILLLLICTILPLSISIKNYSLRKIIVLPLVGGIMLLHLLAEGCRWQLIPAYLIILIATWCLYKSYYFFKGSRFRKIASGVFYVILLAIGWAAPYAIPVFDLPTPTGTYSIGSQYIHIKTNEDEIITNQEGDKRELMVKVWYPAIIKDAVTVNKIVYKFLGTNGRKTSFKLDRMNLDSIA